VVIAGTAWLGLGRIDIADHLVDSDVHRLTPSSPQQTISPSNP
jgi:hypothetical protein